MRERNRKVQCNSGREKVTVVCVLLAASEQSKQARKSRNMTKEADQDERERVLAASRKQQQHLLHFPTRGEQGCSKNHRAKSSSEPQRAETPLPPTKWPPNTVFFLFLLSLPNYTITQLHSWLRKRERERKRAQFNFFNDTAL